jgi:hypothetical protein
MALRRLCPRAQSTSNLLDVGLRLEVVASNEVGDVIVILVVILLGVLALLLLHALVALGELAQRCERVGAELVEDTGNELCQLLVLTGAVDGEGVGGYRGVDCSQVSGGTMGRRRDGWCIGCLAAAAEASCMRPCRQA